MMSLKSNHGKIPEFTMVNILNSRPKRSYKINKAPEKQLKKGKGNTIQTTQNKKQKQNKKNKTKQKTKNKNNNKSKPTPQTIKQNKATNCEMKVNVATLHK